MIRSAVVLTLVAVAAAASPAHAEVGLSPQKKALKAAIGSGGVEVKLGLKGFPYKYKEVSSSVVAVAVSGPKKRKSDATSVYLAPGRWKMTRTVTYRLRETTTYETVQITPVPGQCVVTGGQVLGSLVDRLDLACTVNGRRFTDSWGVPF